MLLRNGHRADHREFPAGFAGACALALCVLVAGPGCAVWDFTQVRYQNATGFFNTYYNARKLFNEGVEEMKAAESEVAAPGEKAPPPPPPPVDEPPPGMQRPPTPGGGMLTKDKGVSSSALVKFDKVIQKCSYILVDYPKSKWVDDALFMIGRSFYYKREYGRADRKFKELLRTFPDGSLYSEGLLWMGKNAIALQDFPRADSTLHAAIDRATTDGDEDVVAEAWYSLGELELLREKPEQAIDRFTHGVEVAQDEDARIRLELALAKQYENLGRKKEARDAYAAIVQLDPSRELRFNAELNYARLSREAGDIDEAAATLSDMLDNPGYLAFDNQLQLEIGHLYRDAGELKAAVDQYRYVDTTFRSQPVSAEACYALGGLYEKEAKDYDKAFDYYNKARTAYPGIEAARLGGKRADELGEYRRLRNRMYDVDTLLYYALHPDSLDVRESREAVADSLERMQRIAEGDVDAGKTEEELAAERFSRRRPHGRNTGRINPFVHAKPTLQPAGLLGGGQLAGNAGAVPGANAAVPNLMVPLYRKLNVRALSPDSILTQLSFMRMEMGWMMLDRFDNADSAAAYYDLALQGTLPDSSRANAYYAMAEIARRQKNEELARVFEDRLISELPNTRFARSIMLARGMEIPKDSVTIAREAYDRAARVLESGDFAGGIAALHTMATSYASSEQAPRALLAEALAYESRPGQGQKALEIYRGMVKNYPNSPYTKRAKEVVGYIDNYEQSRAIAEKKEAERQAAEDAKKEQAGGTRLADRGQRPPLRLPPEELRAERDSARAHEGKPKKDLDPTQDADFPLLPEGEYKPKKNERPPPVPQRNGKPGVPQLDKPVVSPPKQGGTDPNARPGTPPGVNPPPKQEQPVDSLPPPVGPK